MFRWCSYCQRLIGEAKPLDKFQVTHGICPSCSKNFESYVAAPNILKAMKLFSDLEEASQSGDVERCMAAVDKALAGGMRASEVIVGVVHPVLGRIGELWESNQISVATEHRFTDFVYQLHKRLPVPPATHTAPLVLLAPIKANCHELGLIMLQQLARERGVACTRLPTGISEEGIREAIARLHPDIVGLSVSLIESLPHALNFAKRIADELPSGSKVILGGQAFRRGDTPGIPDNVTVVQTIDTYLEEIASLQCRTEPSDEPQSKDSP